MEPQPATNENTVEVAITPPQPISPTTTLVSADRADRRRDWALWMIWGGALAMTFSSVFALFLVRDSASYAFYLGLAAHLNTFLVLSAIGGLLVKRNLEISREGINFDDRDQQSGRNE